ncbi:MAG: response regulator transcription factor, partial [Acutalibacteraceae bacterium]|nr:response regulator transcription factor [Acutalibacteraceae bacterium]
MKKILVVEDEAAIREFVVINLHRAGYETIEAANGEEALEKFAREEDFSVVLLDIMMPGIDGLSVCKEIRAKNGTVGIIMLTAKSQEMDKVSALMMGADDYMTKPFSPTELVARVDSLNRRVEMLVRSQQTKPADEIIQGDFVLNLRRRTLEKNGIDIDLTPVEFQIIEYLF